MREVPLYGVSAPQVVWKSAVPVQYGLVYRVPPPEISQVNCMGGGQNLLVKIWRGHFIYEHKLNWDRARKSEVHRDKRRKWGTSRSKREPLLPKSFLHLY
jgi:hypothetical protein